MTFCCCFVEYATDYLKLKLFQADASCCVYQMNVGNCLLYKRGSNRIQDLNLIPEQPLMSSVLLSQPIFMLFCFAFVVLEIEAGTSPYQSNTPPRAMSTATSSLKTVTWLSAITHLFSVAPPKSALLPPQSLIYTRSCLQLKFGGHLLFLIISFFGLFYLSCHYHQCPSLLLPPFTALDTLPTHQLEVPCGSPLRIVLPGWFIYADIPQDSVLWCLATGPVF